MEKESEQGSILLDFDTAGLAVFMATRVWLVSINR